MNWLNDLVNQHSEFEAPLNFWKWSGLAAISAVIKDRVWLDRYLYSLYPNIYVMLHAESGLKKGPPVSMAARLVSQVNGTKIIQGRASIQGILKEMGTAHTQPGSGGKVTSNAKVFICSSELTSSIVEDKVAATILTDLFDRQYRFGDWASLLKMESFKLVDPCVTMLTATNDAHSKDFFTQKDVNGGYFARTFIVYEHTENRSNSLIIPPKHIPDYKELGLYLRDLVKLQGPFQSLGARECSDVHTEKYTDPFDNSTVYFTKAGLIYEDWYFNFKRLLKEQQIKDETGTMNRFGDSVLKVAMLLSLARSPELYIDETSMEDAIVICEKLIGNIRRTMHGASGLSGSAILKARIIDEFLNRENHEITRTMLMRKYMMHMADQDEFDNVMNQFVGAGMITYEAMGNQMVYRMVETQVKELKRFFAGENAMTLSEFGILLDKIKVTEDVPIVIEDYGRILHIENLELKQVEDLDENIFQAVVIRRK